jgi:OPA family glycerol-3-phosphate transporter-like MFS transporter 1/2
VFTAALCAPQIIAGLFQSTGWPSVVAIMANWFGKGKRGLVMGVWNAHTSIGNILGTVVAAACLRYGWGYSFILPGLLLTVLGVVVWALLVVQPQDVGLSAPGTYEVLKNTDLVGFVRGRSGGWWVCSRLRRLFQV